MLKKKSILIIKIKIMKTVSNEAKCKGIRCRKIGNTVSQGYIEEQDLSIVIQPRSPEPRTQKPRDQKPRAQKPRARIPEAQSPEAQSPEAQSPEPRSPEPRSPEPRSPEAQKPRAQEPSSLTIRLKTSPKGANMASICFYF